MVGKMVAAIVGSGIASKTAAETLLAGLADKDELIIITRDERVFYSRVLLADYISGDLGREELMLASSIEGDPRRARFVRNTVSSIDIANRSVGLAGGSSVRYDKLIIASGASPQRLDLESSRLAGIFYLRDLEDADAIREEASRVETCTVIGGGLVSLKAACALNRLGKRVTILTGSGRLLSLVADATASELVQEILLGKGIEIRFNAEVRCFQGSAGRVTASVLQDGSTVDGEMVIIGKGVRPNLDFVQGTEIEVDKGILVDDRMETTAKGVFAAGDVAQSADLLNRRSALFTLWPDAAVQGRVAASNVLGREKRYTGGLSMNSVVISDVPFIFLGMVRETDCVGCETYKRRSAGSGFYRKIVTRNGRLVGALLAGNIDYAGMLHWDIRSGRQIENPEDYLSLDGLTRTYISRVSA
jgi:NAD(P)H-nitrite reductase large subunit